MHLPASTHPPPICFPRAAEVTYIILFTDHRGLPESKTQNSPLWSVRWPSLALVSTHLLPWHHASAMVTLMLLELTRLVLPQPTVQLSKQLSFSLLPGFFGVLLFFPGSTGSPIDCPGRTQTYNPSVSAFFSACWSAFKFHLPCHLRAAFS